MNDNQGNIYGLDSNATNPGEIETWIFSAPVTTALNPGDSITVHFSGSPPNAKAVSVLAVDGLASVNPLDATQANAGSSPSPDSGLTSMTSYPQEFLLGAIGVQGPNTDSFTPGGGYALIGRVGTNDGAAATNVTLNPEILSVSATGQYNAGGTIFPSGNWAAAIATYVIETGPVVAQTSDQTNNEGDTANVPIAASDADGDPLSYSAINLPPGLNIDASTGLISGTIAGTAADQAPFSVDVSVTDGSRTVHDLFTWTVNNVAPAVTAWDLTLQEGAASGPVTVATFTDVGGVEPLGNYTAVIDWGDGTPPVAGLISEAGGTFTVESSHSYAEESAPGHTPGGLDYYLVTVTISDDNGVSSVSSTASSKATVADPALIASGGFVVQATEGQDSGLQNVAAFTDPGGPEDAGDYQALIDWGDGTAATPGVIIRAGDVFDVQGSHVYAEENAASNPEPQPYHVLVTISHESSTHTAIVSSVAFVADPAVIATGGSTLNAMEGQDSGLQTVATFSDPGGAEITRDYAANIYWGDGSTATAGSITDANGVFTVQGAHTYEESGNFPITVTIFHETASAVTVGSVAVVTDAVILAAGTDVSGFEFSPLIKTPLATFTHADNKEPASEFNAEIHWGDGSISSGQVSLAGSVYTVTGSHTYTEERTFPIEVVVRENGPEGSPRATAIASAQILEELLPGDSRGTPNERFISEVYRDLLYRHVDSAGLAQWSGLLAAGVSRQQIIEQIQQTAEYADLATETLFQRYLHRAPDASGLSHFANLLLGGATAEQVSAILVSSTEFLVTQAGGMYDGFLNALYQDALQRPIDSSGLAWWRFALSAGSSRMQVAEQIIASPEYRLHFVQQAYVQLLYHPADIGGLNAWVNLLNAGGSEQFFYAGICASQEFFDKTSL